VVEDVAGRDALAERFWYSQTFSQDDPWAERASGAAREQHAHMAHFQPLALEVAE
jgi:nitrite reductase (NADH) large subunit